MAVAVKAHQPLQREAHVLLASDERVAIDRHPMRPNPVHQVVTAIGKHVAHRAAVLMLEQAHELARDPTTDLRLRGGQRILRQRRLNAG